jgi:hypothetical protein
MLVGGPFRTAADNASDDASRRKILPDAKDPIESRDIDATTATAHLPGLDIEIAYRRSPSGDAEHISINLQAVPSFEAFGRFIEGANPFAFWAQAVQMAWLPWLAATRAVLPPGLTLPRPELGAASRFAGGTGESK